MVVLNFTLSPENCARLYDALNCLSKFNDLVCIEARYGQLALSALNSSKSAYAFFVLSKTDYFWEYEFVPDDESSDSRFSCRFLIKALASVFKGRVPDVRGGEGTVERCVACLQDSPDEAECRLVIKLFCKQGVTKTHKLTYESAEMERAIFNRSRATNVWKIQARMLRELSEYFAPKTEQLDIYSEEGSVTLTSYTERIVHGKEVLKQPMQSAVTIKKADFDDFNAQEMVHIGISVKDFRNIITHADSLRVTITALYSQPSQPLQFGYSGQGLRCEFTLMTIGTFRGSTVPAASRAQTHDPKRRTSVFNGSDASRATSEMLPPLRTPGRPESRSAETLGGRSERIPSDFGVNRDSEPLFVTRDDDDRQWEPQESRDDDNEILGWDASADNDTFRPAARSDNGEFGDQRTHAKESIAADGIAPTQRASQIRGLFD